MVRNKIYTSQIIEGLRNTGHFDNVSIGDEKRLVTSINEFLESNKTNKLVNVGIDFDQTIYIIFEAENTFKTVNNGQNTFTVLHAYFNGLGDRTTYYGLFHGHYDFSSYQNAIDDTRQKNMVFYIK